MIDSAQYVQRLQALKRNYGYQFARGVLEGISEPGWLGVVEAALSSADGESTRAYFQNGLCWTALYEKYGTLRLEYASTDALPAEVQTAIDAIVNEAEISSEQVCAYCGAPASESISPSGWVRYVCPEHRSSPVAPAVMRALADARDHAFSQY